MGRSKGSKSSKRSKHLLSTYLRHDPIPWLRSAEDPAIDAMVERDLCGQKVDLVGALWPLKEPQRLIKKQLADGSWKYPTPKEPPFNYELYQTFNMLGVLVSIFGFDKRHPAVQKAAEYVFGCQSDEGDYRGIYGNQPAHTYTSALMELLIQAGYQNHESIERAFGWLRKTRQKDGGWAIPSRTVGQSWHAEQVEPNLEKPYSHLVTGMVLRAFASHPKRKRSNVAKEAAALLEARLFLPDKYPDRRGKEYWTRFAFPFQFTDLLTSLDSFSRMGFSADQAGVARSIEWFSQQQRDDGSFALKMLKGQDARLPYWLGLALCRALKRFV
jgi:hypothetical protein